MGPGSKPKKSCLSDPESGVGDVSQSVGDEVEGEDREKYGQTRKQAQPGGIGELVEPCMNHGSPAGCGRTDAEADETEAGLHNNGGLQAAKQRAVLVQERVRMFSPLPVSRRAYQAVFVSARSRTLA